MALIADILPKTDLSFFSTQNPIDEKHRWCKQKNPSLKIPRFLCFLSKLDKIF